MVIVLDIYKISSKSDHWFKSLTNSQTNLSAKLKKKKIDWKLGPSFGRFIYFQAQCLVLWACASHSHLSERGGRKNHSPCVLGTKVSTLYYVSELVRCGLQVYNIRYFLVLSNIYQNFSVDYSFEYSGNLTSYIQVSKWLVEPFWRYSHLRNRYLGKIRYRKRNSLETQNVSLFCYWFQAYLIISI